MTNAFPPAMLEKLAQTKVVAVLVVDDAGQAVPLARALLQGGVDVMELTLRTPAAVESLRRIKAEVPEMTVGIGTILTTEQIQEVTDAGADFGVAPGFNPQIVQAARDANLPFAPGICTPSDIEGALTLGCRLLKFFPAESMGGLKTLTSMAAPYAHLGVRYIPLGGLHQENFIRYLQNPAIVAVGGSWLASRTEISEGDWAGITAKAAAATRAIATLE